MRLIFIPLFALWLGGCADENRPVATIAGEAIAGETIRAIVAKLPVGLRNKEGGDAARQQYLQSIIDRRLLLTEAAAHGMDTLRAVTRKVRETVDGRVIVLYRSRFLAPEAAVPEGEVRRVFEEEGYDRERKLNAILVRTRDEIDEVAALLATGLYLGPDFLLAPLGLASPATVRDALVRGIAVVDPVADEQGPGAGLPP